ncbi:MAG: hypothetical protein ACYTEZ_05335 [Planctomycetota bacterium]|jgi:hypothetical protein
MADPPDPRVAKGERELRFLLRWTGSGRSRGGVLKEAAHRERFRRAAQQVLESGISSGSSAARYGKVGCMVGIVVVCALFALLIHHWLAWVLLGALGLFYLYCAALLAFSPNITAWMRAAREAGRRVDERVRRRGRRPS